jgi:hypothetical protein
LRLGWLGGFSPTFPLCITDALSSGSTQFSSFAFWNFRRSGWLGRATWEHGPEFGNLRVDVSLLFLETENGRANDFGSEFCRHVFSLQ